MSKSAKINLKEQATNFFLETGRSVKLGFTNVWRNKYLSLATVLVIAVIICIFNCILAVKTITQNAINGLNEKIDVIIYLQDSISFYDANRLQEQIENLPGVKSVDYISKEQALGLVLKTYPETSDFLTKFNLKNPLPPSLSITTQSAQDHQNVINYIQKSSYSRFVEFPASNSDQEILSATAKNLININNFIKQLIFWIVFIFVIGGALVIINAIQLTIYNRKKEIYVMRLVGATPHFVRTPFVTEAAIYALISIILSLFFIYFVSRYLGVESLLLTEFSNTALLAQFIIIETLVTILLSILSTLLTVERYLQGKLIFD